MSIRGMAGRTRLACEGKGGHYYADLRIRPQPSYTIGPALHRSQGSPCLPVTPYVRRFARAARHSMNVHTSEDEPTSLL